MKLINFVCKYTDDKTILRIVDTNTFETLYEGRQEFLRNDYGEKYEKAYNSKLIWLDNTSDNVLLIYVECEG